MAGKRRNEEPPSGAPDWMVTYGDMMTLLLCFFVMLVSLSEVRTEKFMRVLESFRRAVGYSEQNVPIPIGEMHGNTAVDKISYYEYVRGTQRYQGRSDQRGQRGPHDMVTMVREGTRTVVGGRIGFPRATADLSPAALEGLAGVLDLLQGHPNKVEVRGHASREPLPTDCRYKNKWDLAYARAGTVAQFLIDRGVDAGRVRIVACGDQEPLKETYETGERWRNRRAEVIMLEATADQFVGPAEPRTSSASPGGLNRG